MANCFKQLLSLFSKKKKVKPEPRVNSNGDTVNMTKFEPTEESPPKNVAPEIEQRRWVYPGNKAFIPDPTGAGGKQIITYPNGLPNNPSGVVIHHTVTNKLNSTVNFFKKNQVSVHFVIGKNGDVVQMVPCNEMAYHAGKSSWGGVKSLNKYFIGIEVINLGPLTLKDDKYFDAYNREYKGKVRKRQIFGYTYWEPFTKEQEAALLKLCKWLISEYKIKIANIVTHYEVSPGRKIDPAGGMESEPKEFREILSLSVL